MARHSWFNPRATLTGLTLLCVVCALLPARWTQVIGSLHGPLLTLLAPIQSPVRWSVMKLRGPERAEASSAEVRQLRESYDDAVQQLLQARRQIDDLRQTMRQLSLGADLLPDVRIRQIPGVSVIGPGADLGALVTLKAGRREGVSEGAVAVLGGVHVVGIVRSIAEYRCSVQPLTDKAIGLVDAVITSDDLRILAECQLGVDAKGVQSGKVKESTDPTAAAPLIAPGMLVRVKDNAWPAAAQMLVLGKVERVDASAEMARRKVVIVTPEYTLSRASEVMLRQIDTSPIAPPSGSPGGRP